jgi:hypothetical protein
MLNKPDREPTDNECTANAFLDVNGRWWMAAWYPQMGGYTSHCWVSIDEGPNTCFDCLVWHNGLFPFEGDGANELHHCNPEQFINFGQKVKAAQETPR